MRTTLEITPKEQRVLTALAQRQGVRRFSALVQEALARYLDDLSTQEVEHLLDLEVVLSESDAEGVRRRVDS